MKLILMPPYPGGMMKRTPVPHHLLSSAPRWGVAQCISNDNIQIVETQFYSSKFSAAIWSADASGSTEFGLQFRHSAIVLSLDLFIEAGSAPNAKTAKVTLSYFPAGSTALSFGAGHSYLIRFELKEAALNAFTSDHPGAVLLLTLIRSKSSLPGSPGSIAIDYREMAILEGIKRNSATEHQLLIELEFSIYKLLQLYFGKLRLHHYPKAGDPDETFARQVRDYVLISPNIQKHTIEKLSRHFLVCSTVLKLRFRRTFGVSIGTYVRRHALERARLLILNTSMTIDEIADETGYEYVNNFNRAFKAQFGETPFSMLHRGENNV